jgi:hypothetical protein
MSDKHLQPVQDGIDMEGFDYAIRHWSDFAEIQDDKFHALRRAYIAAADKLEGYIEAYSVAEGEEDEDEG